MKYIEYDGKTQNISELSRMYGLSNRLIRDRISLGWSIDKALKTPLKKYTKKCKNGHEYIASNLRFDKFGARICRECNRLKSLAFHHRKKLRN